MVLFDFIFLFIFVTVPFKGTIIYSHIHKAFTYTNWTCINVTSFTMWKSTYPVIFVARYQGIYLLDENWRASRAFRYYWLYSFFGEQKLIFRFQKCHWQQSIPFRNTWVCPVPPPTLASCPGMYLLFAPLDILTSSWMTFGLCILSCSWKHLMGVYPWK